MIRWIYRHPRFYNLVDTCFSFSMANRVRRRTLGGLAVRSVLEIGVGSGKNLASMDSGFRIGFDMSAEMLRYSKRHYPEACMVRGDAHSLPIKGDSLDLCVFCFCLRSLARPLDAVREALRVAARVIVIDYSRPTVVPLLLWDGVVERMGRLIFGSRNLNWDGLVSLGARARVTDVFGSLYRIVVLEGADDARV